MKALLDTHALLWWFERPSRLSVPQRNALRKAADKESLWVSDISIWEVGMLAERGRVRFDLPLHEWLERAVAAPMVQRCGISPAIVGELVSLGATRDWDPADRILVATARVLGAKLITSDTRITESGLVATVS